MAKARTTTVYLQKFFNAQPERNRWTEFDDDEFVECIALGSLPRPFAEDGMRLTRDIAALDLVPDNEANKAKRMKMLEDLQKRQEDLKQRERVRMVVKWLIRDPETQEPIPEPAWVIDMSTGQMVVKFDPFSTMDMNLERAITHVLYNAFATREEEKQSLGEESGSEPPSEERDDTQTLTPLSLPSAESRSKNKATSKQGSA